MPADPNLLQPILDEVAPQGLRETLRQKLTADDFDGVISYQEMKEFAAENKLTLEQAVLVIAEVAKAFARPEISGYEVGAVAQGSKTKAFYLGANMEFAGSALSFTLHAEQAATTNAWDHGEEGLLLIAVNAAPCGYCRQFLYEVTTAEKLMVLLKEKQPQPLTKFLLEPFGPKDLGVEGGLMTPEDHGLELAEANGEPIVQAALAAASQSYAPLAYTPNSPSYAGAAVETGPGDVFAGRVALNAAYNPSLSPLEAAMTRWNFSAAREDRVTRVALVQVEGAIADQGSATEAVVDSLRKSGPVTYDQYPARVPSG
jgi:cytidine deaminase